MIRALLWFSIFGILSARFALAEIIDSSALFKQEGDYQMAWGEYEGQAFWDYLLDDQLQFRVVEDLMEQVDNLISTAEKNGWKLNHIDPEVIWFCEKETIDKNLVFHKE